MKPYDHKKIEKKWQATWKSKKIYQVKESSKKPKYMTLVEFPFPSGDGLHTGHIRSYTAMDVVSRKRRMEGFNVLYPIGWDAFGLPTENYAIKTGIHPKIVTKKNTDTFRRQLQAAGFSFDWSREVDTSDPKYYKWTQWIFLQLYKQGLAYKKKMFINWCPKDKIGLANEEVVNGCCDRCGTVVEQREKDQWMLAITKYADRLDRDLDTVNYLEKIKIQQRNWIGRSEGAEFRFKMHGGKAELGAIDVFTTRADTLFGVTYVVLAPEHKLMAELLNHVSNKAEVTEYVAKAKALTEIERTDAKKDKTGVELKGITAVNPANGEKVPVYVADYVLAGYGTGAVMAVPAHDERDFAFAKKYNLQIKQVITPVFYDKLNPVREGVQNVDRHGLIIVIKHWSEDKYLLDYSPKFGWKCLFTGGIEPGEDPLETAIREVQEETGYQNIKEAKYIDLEHIDKFHAAHKGVNRTAYQKNIFVQLADGQTKERSQEEKDLHHISWATAEEMRRSITLPNHIFVLDTALNGFKPYTEQGVVKNSAGFDGQTTEAARAAITKKFGTPKVTYKLKDWVFSRQRYWGEPIPMISCDKCGWVPVPEKDLPVTLPNVKDYLPTDNGESPLAAMTKWVNVKCPQCMGKAKRETDTMPNWAGSSWYYLRYADPKNSKQFADPKKLDYWMPVDWYNGGMEHTTLHLLYSRFWHKFLYDIKVVPQSEPYLKRTSHGLILAEGGVKMSKSIGNVVNPDGIIENYGADTLRLYEMFLGPFDQAVAWSMESIIGPRRFVERVWKLQTKLAGKGIKPEHAALTSLVQMTVQKISEQIEAMQFNTCISALMILVNEFEKHEMIDRADFSTFLQLLAPFAPHVTEELWTIAGNKGSIHLAAWPKVDQSKIKNSQVTVVVQINGKVRAQFETEAGIDEKTAVNKAKSLESIVRALEGKEILRTIFVPNKIVNFVIKM